MEGTCIYPLADASQLVFDLPPTIGFSFPLSAWSLRGHPPKLARVSSSGFVFGTAHRLLLMAVLKSQFMNSMCYLLMVEPISA